MYTTIVKEWPVGILVSSESIIAQLFSGGIINLNGSIVIL